MEEEFNEWFKQNKTRLQSAYMVGAGVSELARIVWNGALDLASDMVGEEEGIDFGISSRKVRED